MAAYRRVYDPRHLQADCQELGSASCGTLRSVIEYGLPLPFFKSGIACVAAAAECEMSLFPRCKNGRVSAWRSEGGGREQKCETVGARW